VRGVCPRN